MSLFDVINATLATKIADALGKYHKGFFTKRVLKTTEEVEANTNPKNLPSALVVGELINDLAQQPQWIKDSTGKITGYTTQEGGAGSVFPFRQAVSLDFNMNFQPPNTSNYTAYYDEVTLDFSAFYAAGFKTITLNITRCDSGGCYTVNGSRKIGKTGTYEIKLNSESNVKFGTRSQTASNIQGNYTAY